MSATPFRAWVLAAAAGFCMPVLAQALEAKAPAQQQVSESCIEVEVGSAKNVSYGCLSQQLTPPAPPAARNNPDISNPALASERAVKLPPNQNGLKTSIQGNIHAGVRRE
ncbi:hypothetical protein AMP9_0509 [plant metagenome]|uniref:Uncharacterized protein n=1 Tax=plant metagenome TaxID=1297885 RepID=A0A484NT16_9ZZZZ